MQFTFFYEITEKIAAKHGIYDGNCPTFSIYFHAPCSNALLAVELFFER
jgi:hypothetical protein